MIINVTNYILGDVRPGGRAGGRRAQESIRHWLEENVGEYLGQDEQEAEFECRSFLIGAGWEFGVLATYDKDETSASTWFVDIADEKLATMFMLRFA